VRILCRTWQHICMVGAWEKLKQGVRGMSSIPRMQAPAQPRSRHVRWQHTRHSAGQQVEQAAPAQCYRPAVARAPPRLVRLHNLPQRLLQLRLLPLEQEYLLRGKPHAERLYPRHQQADL
jgi:hypothetical protein